MFKKDHGGDNVYIVKQKHMVRVGTTKLIVGKKKQIDIYYYLYITKTWFLMILLYLC